MNRENNSIESVQVRTSKLDRRKILKAGALTGAAGLLAMAGAGGLNSGQAATAGSSAPVDFQRNLDTLLVALVGEKIIDPFSAVTFFYVPANASVIVNQKVTPGYVSIITEDRITVGQDHALQLSMSVDGKQILFDPDMVQARYDRPLQFLGASSFYSIHENLSILLTNKTSRARYFSSMQSGGKMLAQQWDSIIVPYLSRVLGEAR